MISKELESKMNEFRIGLEELMRKFNTDTGFFIIAVDTYSHTDYKNGMSLFRENEYKIDKTIITKIHISD